MGKKLKINKSLKSILSNKPLMLFVAILVLAAIFSTPNIRAFLRMPSEAAGIGSGVGIGNGTTIGNGIPSDILLTAEKQLTGLPKDFDASDVYGNYIVGIYHSGSSDEALYVYNISTKIASNITKDLPGVSGHFGTPRIDGNNVVYQAYKDAKQNILKYSITNHSTVALLDSNVYNFIRPEDVDIYADKVVFASVPSNATDIYMLSLSNNHVSPICTAGGVQSWPRINKNIIVWQDSRNDNADIYMYNLKTNTETPVVTNTYTQVSPEVYGNKVVWADFRNDLNGWPQDNNIDIYMYDVFLMVETPIAVDILREDQLYIAGDFIVYRHEHSLVVDDINSDIYLYRISAGKKYSISTGDWRKQTPMIQIVSPNVADVIWNDERDSNYGNKIYMRRVKFLY